MVGPGCVHQLTHPSLSRCSLWGSDVGRLDSSSKSSPVPHGGGKQRHDLAGHLDQGASRPPNRTRQCPYGCQSPSRRQEWGGVAGAVTPERQGKPAGSLSSLCIRPAFPSGSVALGIPARVPAPSTSLVTRGRRVLGLGYRQARSGASEAAPPPPREGDPSFPRCGRGLEPHGPLTRRPWPRGASWPPQPPGRGGSAARGSCTSFIIYVVFDNDQETVVGSFSSHL